MTKPFIVDPRRTVARAENQVGEIFAAIRLAEPVGKRELGIAADGGERVQRALAVRRVNENIQVLRVAPDAGVALERIRAADEKRYARLAQRRQHARSEERRVGKE